MHLARVRRELGPQLHGSEKAGPYWVVALGTQLESEPYSPAKLVGLYVCCWVVTFVF
ncbi:MAG TPA: hypothetical protein VFW73_03265 [Lacipirellulaceae bacterium]|nr:hypothetical protein [Lacipirellulaceae bacterium]